MIMRTIYQLIAAAGAGLVLLPAVLHYLDRMGNDQMKSFVLLGTMLWFAGAIPWLGRKKREKPGP